jgi:hypothetical protein
MMLKNKQFRLCFSLLVLLAFTGVGRAYGQEPSRNELLPAENQGLIWEKLESH